MFSVVEDIARYRDAAARCRMLAANTLTKEAKATLLDLAADFEARVTELEAMADRDDRQA